MKWYGSYQISKKKTFNNIKLSKKKFIKNNFFKKSGSSNLNFYKINFYMPNNWNFILLKKNYYDLYIYFYIYTERYFFILLFLRKFVFFFYDFILNTISFNFIFKNNFYSIFWSYFKIIFFSFSKIFFKKLKFKGKGYYIYKNNRNTIALQFGYSHLLYLYSFFISVKFITKTILLFFGINSDELIKISNMLYNVKKINIFTGKGIRFAKQIIYKKTGKISSYR